MEPELKALITELLGAISTKPEDRGNGKGFCKKPIGNGSIELAITNKNNNGWDWFNPVTQVWEGCPHECIEAKLINFSIRSNVEIGAEDKAKFESGLAEANELIEMYADNPEKLQKKIEEKRKIEQSIDDKSHYVYLYFRDRNQAYSLRSRPHNNFVSSLFSSLNKLTKFKDSGLKNPIKICPTVQTVTGKSGMIVVFASIWINEVQHYNKKDEFYEREYWKDNWKDIVQSVGTIIRKLHNQKEPWFGVSSALPAGSDYSEQSALPPSRAQGMLENLQKAANEAFNDRDMDRVSRIIDRLVKDQQTIDTLGDLIDEAKEYVANIATEMAKEPDVIDVDSAFVDDSTIPALLPSVEAEPEPVVSKGKKTKSAELPV